MSITSIQRLGVGFGTPVIPNIDDYDESSSVWRETEHRAHLPGTQTVGGAWEGEPGWVAIHEWPYHEICVIMTGRVAVESSDGDRMEFGPGESFCVPKGFNGVWHTLEPTQKIFVGVHAE